MFENTIFALMYSSTHHANFVLLCILGDLSILFVGIVLWRMFLPSLQDSSRRLALFVPVAWLLFQLSYAETVNWAAPGIQNLYIVAFSLTTFYFLGEDLARSFFFALCFLILSIATSGNCFIAAIVGMVLLIAARRVRHLLLWLGTTAGMALFYAYHYNVMSSQSPKQHSIAKTLLHLKLFYVLPFLGSVAELLLLSHRLWVSTAFGIGLLLLLAFHLRRRGVSVRSPVNAAILFVLLASLGVAGLRSDFGAGQSLSGRYRIYSSLLVILCWFVLSERYLEPHTDHALQKNRLYLGAVTFSVCFGLAWNASGYRFLKQRDVTLRQGMSYYEHPTESGPASGPMYQAPPEMNGRVQPILKEAEQLDIYHPEALPAVP